MYQAQVFLARTGASELDSVFNQAAQQREAQLNAPTLSVPDRPEEEAAPTAEVAVPPVAALERPVTGQNALVIDEDAPTGPNKVVDPKARPKTAAWAPTRPQGHESVDSEQLRSAVTSALSDIQSELGQGNAGPNEETVMTGPPSAPVTGPPPSQAAPDLALPTIPPTGGAFVRARFRRRRFFTGLRRNVGVPRGAGQLRHDDRRSARARRTVPRGQASASDAGRTTGESTSA